MNIETIAYVIPNITYQNPLYLHVVDLCNSINQTDKFLPDDIQILVNQTGKPKLLKICTIDGEL